MHYANCRKPTNIVKYCMIPFISHSEKGKTIRMEKRSVVARYRGRGWFDYKMLQQGNFFFWYDGSVLHLHYGADYTIVSICQNSY